MGGGEGKGGRRLDPVFSWSHFFFFVLHLTAPHHITIITTTPTCLPIYTTTSWAFIHLPLLYPPSTLSKTFLLPSYLLSSPPLHPFLFFSFIFFFHISISSNPTLTYINYFSPNESRSSGFGACAVYHSGLFLFFSFRLRFNTLLCE